MATVDANNNRTSQEWNFGTGQVSKEIHADGGAPTSQFDVFGNLRVVTDAMQRVTRYTYDQLNELTRLDRPTRAGTDNLAGQASWETYEYDSQGRRIASTSVLGRVRTYFDIEGRVAKVTSAEGRSTSYGYIWDATLVGTGTNQVGGWKQVTTAVGGMTSSESKDVFGRMSTRTDFGGHVYRYTYNGAGWLKTQTSARNGVALQNLSYEYYTNGYIKSQTDNVYAMVAEYAYDNNGNRTSEIYKSKVDPTQVYQDSFVTYDELNRVKNVVGNKFSVSYKYDAMGNRRNINSYYHDGVSGDQTTQDLWYTYDGMNRFTITMGSLVNGHPSSTPTAVSS